MTDREKAIKEIKILKEDYWDDDGYGHETNQHADTMFALDMAIKALEQEPKIAHVISDEDGNIKCSNCGSHECWGNYCSECGAKMEVQDADNS